MTPKKLASTTANHSQGRKQRPARGCPSVTCSPARPLAFGPPSWTTRNLLITKGSGKNKMTNTNHHRAQRLALMLGLTAALACSTFSAPAWALENPNPRSICIAEDNYCYDLDGGGGGSMGSTSGGSSGTASDGGQSSAGQGGTASPADQNQSTGTQPPRDCAAEAANVQLACQNRGTLFCSFAAVYCKVRAGNWAGAGAAGACRVAYNNACASDAAKYAKSCRAGGGTPKGEFYLQRCFWF